jgi:hypothetical protein
MEGIMAFFHQNTWFIIIIVVIAGILAGRIWSDWINRGDITDPLLVIRKGRYYKVVNTYVPTHWTEDWIVGSIICLKAHHRKLFISYSRDIYVSGDRVRFTDGGPVAGSLYQVTTTKKSTGAVVMTPVKTK